MKTVIVIDDEKDARDLLLYYIASQKELTVIKEASNGFEAVEAINELKPDLVFLDIQMPGLNGFEVLKRLQEIPDIIFSTAFDEYAIKAFEVHAVDYLLKPYGKKRFENAINRILKNQDKIIPLAEELLNQGSAFPTKIILHKGSKKVMISVCDILYAEAFGDYTKVYTKTEEFLSTKGISDLQNSFEPSAFLRLHRSHFVSINAIAELRKVGRYYHIFLSMGKDFRVSETYLPAIRKMVF